MELTDQPSSICHIQSIHMYTLQSKDPQKPDPPFTLLTGEMVLYSGNSVDGLIVITNYRLYLQNGENQYHIPSGLIEVVEIRELFYLQLLCKDARTYRCTFENNETAMEWYERVTKAAEPPRQLEQVFAFYHCMWAKEKRREDVTIQISNQKRYTFDKEVFEIEMARMQFQGDSWRITKANENYKVCPTYPPYLLVPSCINDEMLESVAKFRSSRRIPVAVWRHTRNGAIIARCSQPEVGWFGWRSSDDEDLLKAISDACNFDRNVCATSSSDRESVLSHSPGSLHSDESLQITGDVVQQEKKLLIMDARSYTTAVANRARGGGCECPEYYPNCEIQFMNLANIHSIRKSFHALRQLCMSSAEQPNWFSLLEGTRWLLHMSGLIKSAVILTTAVERDARPVLVHCSDGWDRTPQIVALAELLLDPYYRTIDGFRVLIEREWLAFGHKFADRCGQSGGSDDVNERCPVFLQWLDCVHQIMVQFPISFEYSHNYLIKLAQHTFSNLYGTFLCNTQKQRSKLVHGKTFSIWELLSGPTFRNHLYSPTQSVSLNGRVLWPKANIRDLRLWSEVYLGSMECNFNSEDTTVSARTELSESNGGQVNMSKTRSYGDLINTDASHGIYEGRRSSDPNVNREGKNVSDDVNIRNAVVLDSKGSRKTVGDFLSSEIDDNQLDCNQDCLYNVHANASSNLTDDQIDGLGSASSGNMTRSKLLESDNTENALNNGLSALFLRSGPLDSSSSESDIESTRSERGSKAENDLDVEGFLEANNNSPPSVTGLHKDTEINGDFEGNRIGVSDPMFNLKKSVETSTETLVSDPHITRSSSKEYNGFEKVINTPNSNVIENCKACVQDDVKMSIENGSSLSATPYMLSWDRACLQNRRYNSRMANICQLGEDGLMPIRSPIQERLDQIFDEHRRTVELLEKELHASRQFLIKQACHKCQNGDEDVKDDNGSVVESINSLSECQASTAGESLHSDVSWVVVEDGSATEHQGKLWVPDHAVSHCTGCGIEFCLGRRRHHCRKCDRFFCADCSEQSVCQLYNSTSMCTGCFSELRQCDRAVNKRTMESLDGCKQNRSCASEQSTQITASSN